MCVVCQMGQIVRQLEALTVKKVREGERELAARAAAAIFLTQAAAASMAGEWGIINDLLAKARQAVDIALEQTQCSECGKPGCPRDRSCEREDDHQPN